MSDKKRGVCVDCGVQTHNVSTFKKTPITNENVYNGNCIKCNPTNVPPTILMEYEYRAAMADTPKKRSSAPHHTRTKIPFPDRRSTSDGAIPITQETPNLPTAKPNDANRTRPVLIVVQDCNVPEANGVYERDETFEGPYNKYTKEGIFNGDVVTFTFHRSSNRWFLSAFLWNGGRHFLLSALFEGDLKSPPLEASAWAKMGEKAGSASIRMSALKSEAAPDFRNHEAAKGSMGATQCEDPVVEDTC